MAEKEMELRAIQTEIDSLIAALPDALKKGEANTVQWIGDFARINNGPGLSFDSRKISQRLQSAGYVRNAHVNDPKVKTNQSVCAQWIVGQAIDYLELKKSIHPDFEKYTKGYKKLFASVESDGKPWSESLGGRKGRARE